MPTAAYMRSSAPHENSDQERARRSSSPPISPLRAAQGVTLHRPVTPAERPNVHTPAPPAARKKRGIQAPVRRSVSFALPQVGDGRSIRDRFMARFFRFGDHQREEQRVYQDFLWVERSCLFVGRTPELPSAPQVWGQSPQDMMKNRWQAFVYSVFRSPTLKREYHEVDVYVRQLLQHTLFRQCTYLERLQERPAQEGLDVAHYLTRYLYVCHHLKQGLHSAFESKWIAQKEHESCDALLRIIDGELEKIMSGEDTSARVIGTVQIYLEGLLYVIKQQLLVALLSPLDRFFPRVMAVCVPGECLFLQDVLLQVRSIRDTCSMLEEFSLILKYIQLGVELAEASAVTHHPLCDTQRLRSVCEVWRRFVEVEGDSIYFYGRHFLQIPDAQVVALWEKLNLQSVDGLPELEKAGLVQKACEFMLNCLTVALGIRADRIRQLTY